MVDDPGIANYPEGISEIDDEGPFTVVVVGLLSCAIGESNPLAHLEVASGSLFPETNEVRDQIYHLGYRKGTVARAASNYLRMFLLSIS